MKIYISDSDDDVKGARGNQSAMYGLVVVLILVIAVVGVWRITFGSVERFEFSHGHAIELTIDWDFPVGSGLYYTIKSGDATMGKRAYLCPLSGDPKHLGYESAESKDGTLLAVWAHPSVAVVLYDRESRQSWPADGGDARLPSHSHVESKNRATWRARFNGLKTDAPDLPIPSALQAD